MKVPLVLAALAFLPMLGEAVLSARHERVLRARGAVEPTDDVITAMQFAYPGGFAVLAVEAWLRQATVDDVFMWGLAVFAAGKAVKYWAIAALGERWTFRVLVPKGSSLVAAGPYRWLRHPNYVGVGGELAGAALMAHAWVSGPIVVAGFGLLLLRRIHVEERALGGTSTREARRG